MTVSMLSGPSPLVVSRPDFEAKVSMKLAERLGVPFPVTKLSPRSVDLGEHTFSPNLLYYLNQKKYVFKHEEKKLKLDHGPALWWIENSKVTFHLRWSRGQFGFHIDLYLETMPLSAGGNHEDAAKLAQHLKDFGLRLHPLIDELASLRGTKRLDCDYLGIEPHVTLVKVFEDFTTEHPLHAQFLKQLARVESLTPFHPSPMKWVDNMALETDDYVPGSVVRELKERWLEQIRSFGERNIP